MPSSVPNPIRQRVLGAALSFRFKLLLLLLKIMPSTPGKTKSCRLFGEFSFPLLQPLVSGLPKQPLPEMQTHACACTHHPISYTSSVRPQGPALTVEKLASPTSSLSTVAPFCFSSSDVILCGFPEPARPVLSKNLRSRC